MARANYGAQFLRIEPRRKLPQSDEVAGDDGQVAAFGLDPWRDSRGGTRWRGGRALRPRLLLLLHFPHLADKADSLARQRADEALTFAIITDCAAGRVDAGGER